ncbi:MAG: tetratricopeptide repeat protein [Polyangiaceae bacterium]
MKRAFLGAAVLLGCAPKLPPAYVHDRDAAESAYASGHFPAAAQSWLEAAKAADTPRDRSDARYRAAASYERAGDLESARELYTLLASGNSDRAARSGFTLADLQIQGGNEAGGYAALEAAIRKYPSSGVASPAYRRYFGFLAAQGGDQAVLDYVARVLPELGSSELGEQLRYERARRFDALGNAAEAREAYVDLADRYPYPHGAYWDDALLRGAECDVRLGQPERALSLLERMLASRETSHLSGSYERPHFADAAYRMAELYRDALHAPAAARRAFHNVFVNYPTSTLRDDALWQEALILRSAGPSAACAPLSLLVQQLPDSRFAPCAHEICSAIRPIPGRQCRDYIQATLK